MISIERYEARGGGGPSPITINKKSNKEILKNLNRLYKKIFQNDCRFLVAYKKCL